MLFLLTHKSSHRLIKRNNRFEFSAPKYYDFTSHFCQRKRGEKERRKEKETETAEMYFETSEKLNGTFSPEREEEVLKFLRGGAHIIWSFLRTRRDDFFYEDISSHHQYDTHSLYYHCTRVFRAFWSLFKNNRITFPARDESDESEPVGVAAAVAVGKRRARDRRSEVVHAAEFTAVVARGNESRRGGVRERGRRGE